MTTNNSAVESIVQSVQSRIDFLAEQCSSEEYPNAGKVILPLAFVGVFCVSRNLYRKSKTLAKCYQQHAKTKKRAEAGDTMTTLAGRYGKPAWAMIVNSVDALGNAYGHYLGAAGFDIILLGPQIDSDRMEGQATTLKERYKVQTHVICVDYHQFSEDAEKTYQEIADKIADYDICILVNNQAYSVPFDFAHHGMLQQSIQSVLATINKHINASLLIQQLIVPKMLLRHTSGGQKKKRSGILTLKTQANAIFERHMVKTLAFPILKSAMAFNSSLTAAMHEKYSGEGIDVMQAIAPYIAFESWLKHGLVLEVVMQEKMLARHVTSILSHLMEGQAESYGTWEETLQNALKLPNTTPIGGLFSRYAEMAKEQREVEVAEATPVIEEVTPVEVCDVIVQTELDLQSFREPVPVTDVDETAEESDGVIDWAKIDPNDIMETFEENEFDYPPVDGEKLEVKNERKIYQAEMSKNMKLNAQATSMTADRLLEMKNTGKPVTTASKILAQKTKEQMMKKMQMSAPPKQMVTQEAKIVEKKPEVIKPVEVKKEVETTKPIEVKPIEKPVEVEKIEVKPVEVKPVEPKPVEVKKIEPVPEEDLKISQSTAASSLYSSQTSQLPTAPKETEPVAKTVKETIPEPVKEEPKPSPPVVKEEPKLATPEPVKEEEPKPATPEPVKESPKPSAAPVEKEKSKLTQKIEETKEETSGLNTASSTPASKNGDDLMKPGAIMTPTEDKKIPPPPKIDTKALEVDQEKDKINSVVTTPREKSNSFSSKTNSSRKLGIVEQMKDKDAAISEKPSSQLNSARNKSSKESERSNTNKSFDSVVRLNTEDQQSDVEQEKPSTKDANDQIALPSMSVASSGPTNDTNDKSSNGEDEKKDKKLAAPVQPEFAPKPYNRLSVARAESQNRTEDEKDEKAENSIQFKNHSFKEDLTAIGKDEEKKNVEEAKPEKESEEKKEEDEEAANPFTPRIDVEDSPPTLKTRGSKIDTPQFKSLESGFGQIRKDSPPSNNDPKSDSDIVSRDSLNSSGKEFMVVRPTRVDQLNRSRRSGSNISRMSDNDKSIGDWRQSPLKEINITSLVQRVKRKTVETATLVSDPDYNKNIEFQDKTLEDDSDPFDQISERQLEEASEESKGETINSMRKSLPLRQTKDADQLPEGEAPKSGRSLKSSLKKDITPRSYDQSSSSDMRELKMALGAFSDRSANNQNNVIYNPQTNMLDIDGPIFSDEGSQDSMGHAAEQENESEAAKHEQIWEMAANAKKASLDFMRAVTQKFEKGDETDQAIKKVLHNLVTNVLSNFDPNNNVENDPNLTKAQKLEKQNQQLIYELATCLPFVKLSPGRYLVGTEIRQIQIKGRGVLVRTGGGYMYLSEFLPHYAKAECLKMGVMILKAQQKSKRANYQKVVIDLLKKHPNTETAQKDFIRKCPSEINQQFTDLVDRTRKHEERVQKLRYKKSMKVTSKTSKKGDESLNLSMHSSDSNRRKTLFPPSTHKIYTPVRGNISSSSNSSPSKSPPVIKSSTKIVSATRTRHTYSGGNTTLNRSLNSSFSSPTMSSKQKSKGNTINPKFSLMQNAGANKSLNNSFSAASLAMRPSNSTAGALFNPSRSKKLTTTTGKKVPKKVVQIHNDSFDRDDSQI